MAPFSALPQWHISFGSGFPAVLADSLFFYIAAVVLLTFLGVGLAALTLPKDVRPFGWLVAPYLGFSLLVTLSGLLVALGATVRVTLTLSLLLATAINLWVAFHGRQRFWIGSPRWWLFFLALALPSYAITALTMAHNGYLAPVSANLDPYLLIPLAEWLKDHPAPTFAIGSGSWLTPDWDASVPPIGDWLAQGGRLGYQDHRPDNTNFLFQRGPRYLDAALGIALGWDSFLVLRPAQALMLSLSLPATFLLAHQYLKAGFRTSLRAALLLGLNGSLFFWIMLVHPGQAVGVFLVPIILALTLSAVQDRGRLSLLSPMLALSALVVSYYHGTPLLVFLLVPCLAYVAMATRRPLDILLRIALIGIAVLAFTWPEHVKLLLVLAGDALEQTSGWGNPGFAGPGDGLGTSLEAKALQMVIGGGQLGSFGRQILGQFSTVATLAALLLALVGMISGRAERMQLFRLMAMGALLMLLYLRLTGYAYGYTKGQGSVTFLLAIALSLGLERLWGWAEASRHGHASGHLFRRSASPVAASTPTLLLIAAVSLQLALSGYIFWKPIGNVWNPTSWEATHLRDVLPQRAEVAFSPNVLADPESVWMGLYFLRDQSIRSVVAIERALGPVTLFQGDTSGTAAQPAKAEVLGTNEVAAARGLLPSDQIWASSLMNAYLSPQSGAAIDVRRQGPNAPSIQLPTRLPITLEITPRDDLQTKGKASPNNRYLIATFAAEAPSAIQVASSQGDLSFQIAKGVTVHSIPVQPGGQITLSSRDTTQPWVLAAQVRNDGKDLPVHEEYPKTLVAVGNSRLEGHTISTRLTYLDVQVPVSHSLDIYDTHGYSHPGWFELPTNPDERIKEIRFDLNAATLEHQATVNGNVEKRRSSTRPPADGEYTAYFTLWAGDVIAKRIPLYRYRLTGGQVVEFEPFGLEIVWDGLGSMR